MGITWKARQKTMTFAMITSAKTGHLTVTKARTQWTSSNCGRDVSSLWHETFGQLMLIQALANHWWFEQIEWYELNFSHLMTSQFMLRMSLVIIMCNLSQRVTPWRNCLITHSDMYVIISVMTPCSPRHSKVNHLLIASDGRLLRDIDQMARSHS